MYKGKSQPWKDPHRTHASQGKEKSQKMQSEKYNKNQGTETKQSFKKKVAMSWVK